MLYRRIFMTFIASLAFIATSLCFAKNISLYDQPKTDAKVIGTINSEAGIIPIFTSTDKNWLKVGDPNNGNVGWVKSSDLNGTTNNITFTQQMINTGNGPHTYVIQYGNGASKTFSTEEEQNFFKQIQIQQETIQKNMQKMINDLYKNTNMQNMNFPIIVPVILMQKPGENTAPVAPQKK